MRLRLKIQSGAICGFDPGTGDASSKEPSIWPGSLPANVPTPIPPHGESVPGMSSLKRPSRREQNTLSTLGLACFVSLTSAVPNAHAQSFNEMASAASAQQFHADVQDRISASTHDGPTAYFSQRYEMTPELEAAMEQRRQDDETVARLRADPVFMRYWEGFWDHYQARDTAQPGEFCAATYTSLTGSVTLTGVDKSWEGGLLMFVGQDIPQPEEFREITATLTQDNGRPATVKIYNLPASPDMPGVGTLIFAVPRMADALSGMENEQTFAVSIEGLEVFRISWKDGRAARDTLRRCIRQR